MKFILISYLTFWAFTSYSQNIRNANYNPFDSIYDSLFRAEDWRIQLDDEFAPVFGSNWKSKILKIGDNYTRGVLGKDILDSTKIVKLEDHKGKIIILDFWATWCSTCIDLFPKMEQLQARFGNRIQILLVNFWNTKSEIERFLQNKGLQLSLPIILGDKSLMVAFPTQSIPYHIWIDTCGTVRLIGTAINTYPEKISDLLNGKNVTFVKDDNTAPRFNKSIPYHTIIGKKKLDSKYFSYFTSFNSEYAVLSGGMVDGVKDSVGGTVRSTFVNYPLLDLFRYAFKKELRNNNIIYSPYYGNIIIQGVDTIDITNQFIEYSKMTDIDFVRSKYCYEQIAGSMISVDSMRKLMQSDITHYFDSLKSIKAIVKEDLVIAKCLVADKITYQVKKFKEFVSSNKKDSIWIHGFKSVRIHEIKLADAIKLSSDSKKIKEQLSGKFLLDNVGDIIQKTILLPINGDLEALKVILKLQGFDIVDKQVPMQFLYLKHVQ